MMTPLHLHNNCKHTTAVVTRYAYISIMLILQNAKSQNNDFNVTWESVNDEVEGHSKRDLVPAKKSIFFV